MKYRVKILLINILSFYGLVFAMEKQPGFLERAARWAIHFVQPSVEQGNPNYILSFSKDEEVDKQINTIILEMLWGNFSLMQFFQDAKEYYASCGDSYYLYRPCSPDLTDFNKMMATLLLLHKGSKSFVVEKLQAEVDLISKQKEIDLSVLFNYLLSPPLLRALGNKIKENKDLIKYVNCEFEDILKRKEQGYKKRELNKIFLLNFCTLDFLIDGLPFSSGGLINQSMHLFPEKVIIELWAHYEKKEFKSLESFKRNYLNQPQDQGRNTLLMLAASQGYAKVVEWLLDKGADTKLINNRHFTACRMAEDAAKDASAERIKSYAKTLDLLHNAEATTK